MFFFVDETILVWNKKAFWGSGTTTNRFLVIFKYRNSYLYHLETSEGRFKFSRFFRYDYEG